MALATTADINDENSILHSLRIATLAKEFAKKLNLDANTAELLELAALVRNSDSNEILVSMTQEKGYLSDEERQKILNRSALSSKFLTKTSLSRIIP